ncbi:TlpA disulfide reductase family protein [Pelagibacteraceae bacterium]|jgi:thiol-disulfide isomerase/thioredoxin|nr:TlpA disulfide reductase family protein [Pelagibacteraceae bacterium]
MFINQKTINFFILIFCFSIFSSISQTNEDVPLNNIALNETPKPISTVIFEDFLGNKINLKDYQGKLIIINFWATWCAPCKKEMPSLDSLYQNDTFKNLKIFAVNMEEPNQLKTKKFFSDMKIKKLEIFFDSNLNFVKEFKLRGVPTTILINKEGKEFARIIGEINFKDKKFLKWLAKYD